MRAVLVNTTLILDGTSVAGQVHLSGLSVRVNAPALRHSSSFLVIVFVLAKLWLIDFDNLERSYCYRHIHVYRAGKKYDIACLAIKPYSITIHNGLLRQENHF